jgi:hypothetical protein
MANADQNSAEQPAIQKGHMVDAAPNMGTFIYLLFIINATAGTFTGRSELTFLLLDIAVLHLVTALLPMAARTVALTVLYQVTKLHLLSLYLVAHLPPWHLNAKPQL